MSRRVTRAAWVFCLGCAILVMSHTASGEEPGIRTDYGVYPEPALPTLPAAGGTLVDPTFGTTILRVTDETDGVSNHTAYSYWPTFNLDATYFHINRSGAARLYAFDPDGFRIMKEEPLFASQAPGGGFPRWEDSIWSGTEPNVIYGHVGLKLWAYNVVTKSYSLVRDFAGVVPPGNLAQMSRSIDDGRFAFTLKNASWQDIGYMAWDRDSDQVLLQESVTSFDEVQLDKTGRYLVIKTGQQGAGVIEVKIADLDEGTIESLTDNGPDYAPGHSDCGHGTVVGADNWRNTYTIRDLATPHDHDIVLQFPDWTQGSHLSMLADDESWALVSTFTANSHPSTGIFKDEIFFVATDGSGDVRRLAHHRSVYESYWDSPRANVSRDGRLVAFTSTWGDSGRRDVFILLTSTDNGLIPGDANFDGKVDSADLALWQQNYDPLGQNLNAWRMGDFNRDAVIDSGDLALWQTHYDPLGGAGGFGSAAHVAEPATWFLAVSGALLLLRRRR